MAKVRICLDPGHGGADPGAVFGNLTEASITLDIALRARKLLIPKYAVILSRDQDQSVGLNERVRMADRQGADLFASVHVNAAESAGASGYEVFVRTNPSASSLFLGSAILMQFAKRWPQRLNRGLSRANFVVLRQSRPVCLVECFFLSNASDRTLLASSAGRAKIAEAIAWGCGNFVRAQDSPLA